MSFIKNLVRDLLGERVGELSPEEQRLVQKDPAFQSCEACRAYSSCAQKGECELGHPRWRPS